MTAREVELPPLPDTDWCDNGDVFGVPRTILYDANQMQAYARTHAIAVAAAARRDALAKAVQAIANLRAKERGFSDATMYRQAALRDAHEAIRALSAQHGENGGAL